MTSSSEEVARSWRQARSRRHRDAAHRSGLGPFVLDALFWSLACAAVFGIFAMAGAVPDYGGGVPTVFGLPEPLDPATKVLFASVFATGFGLLMAWGGQRIRNARRNRNVHGQRVVVKMGEDR